MGFHGLLNCFAMGTGFHSLQWNQTDWCCMEFDSIWEEWETIVWTPLILVIRTPSCETSAPLWLKRIKIEFRDLFTRKGGLRFAATRDRSGGSTRTVWRKTIHIWTTKSAGKKRKAIRATAGIDRFDYSIDLLATNRFWWLSELNTT